MSSILGMPFVTYFIVTFIDFTCGQNDNVSSFFFSTFLDFGVFLAQNKNTQKLLFLKSEKGRKKI